MREIKFRAWDKDRKEMVYDLPVIIFCDKAIWPHDLSWFHNSQQWTEDEGLITNYDLLQYTGLKDSKGVEIYEEDIVKIPEGYGGDMLYKPFIGRIKYDAPEFYVNQQDNIIKTSKWCGQEYDWDKIEVIGNIYENPSLL